MKFQQIIREYFTFTKNERIGLIILLVLILILMGVNHFIFYFEKPGKADREKFERLLAILDEKQQQSNTNFSTSLFHFNPNIVDSLKLDSLQLPAKVKNNLLKYRDKGGHFYRADDFRKIYGMNDSLFEVIEPYIEIEKVKKKRIVDSKAAVLPVPKIIISSADAKSEKAVILKIEVNTATADELKKLRGIGDAFSKRIIKYRDLLGGFYNLAQLSEVYGLKPETIENILPYLQLNDHELQQINVNFAEAKQLAHHPYISWELANKVVNFRSKNGFIDNLQILRLNGLINDADYKRISPYLKTKN